MMKAVWGCLCLGLASPLWADTKLPIVVSRDKTLDHQLFALGTDVLVEGRVEGNLNAISSKVTIRGAVDGHISVLNGTVILEPGAQVRGSIVCLGGEIRNLHGVEIGGKSVCFFGQETTQATTLPLSGKAMIALFFARTLFLFLSVIAVFYFFPTHVQEASFDLLQDVVRTVAAGIVALALFGFALLASFLLMVIAVGIPLFVLLVCALTVVVIFGQVVVFYRLGQFIEHRGQGRIHTVAALLLGVFLLSLLSEIPWVGVVVPACVLVLGTGAVFLTRFGTNKAWFTGRPRYWSAG